MATTLVGCDSSDSQARSTFENELLIEGKSYCEELQGLFNVVVSQHIALNPTDKDPFYKKIITELMSDDAEVNAIAPSERFLDLQEDFFPLLEEQGSLLLENSCEGVRTLASYRQNRVDDELSMRESPYALGFARLQDRYDQFKDKEIPGVLVYTYYEFIITMAQALDVFTRFEATPSSASFRSFGIRTDASVFTRYGVGKPASYGGVKILALDDQAAVEDSRPQLKVGDQILKVEFQDGQFPGLSGGESFDISSGIAGSDLQKLESYFEASPFEQAMITVRRTESEEVSTEIQVTRRSIPLALKNSRPMAFAKIRDGVLYARLFEFGSGSAQQLSEKIDELKSQYEGELKGIVLDLRDNPGGSESEMKRVAGLFMTSQLIGYVQVRSTNQNPLTDLESFPVMADSLSQPHQDPLVVVLNNASASAAEVLAAVLQDSGRALIVGERSFGKHVGQIPISFGAFGNFSGEFWLTVKRFFTNDGQSLQGIGVSPTAAAKYIDPRIKKMREDCIGAQCLKLRLEDIEEAGSRKFLLPIEGEEIDENVLERLGLTKAQQKLPEEFRYEYANELLTKAKGEAYALQEDSVDFAIRILNHSQARPEAEAAPRSARMSPLEAEPRDPSESETAPPIVVRRIP